MLRRERLALKAIARIYRAGNTPEERLAVAVNEMTALGGLYVKFAQLLLLNHEFSKNVPAPLRRAVFDRVRVDKQEDYSYFLSQNDLRKLSQKIISIEQRPSYAGSFAAVFDARTKDGQKVIVKAIRPELHHNVVHDLRMIRLISRSIGMFKEEVRLALRSAYSTFRLMVLKELDYTAEVKNAQLLAEHFTDDPYIRIPHTFAEISNDRLIVQQKFEGVWISELLQKELSGQGAIKFVNQQIASDLYQQLYYLGFKSMYNTMSGLPVHGDPHPGNVVLMPNNQIGLIDFGVIAQPIHNRLALLEYVKEQILGKEGKSDIPRLMLSLLRFHAGYLYQAIESLSEYYHHSIVQDVYKFLKSEIDMHRDSLNEQAIANGQYSNVLSAAINRNNRFALVPQIDSPITQKAFITIWRTYEELGFPELTLRVFKDVVSKVEQDFDTKSWQESAMPISRAFEVIGEWLSGVAERDPALFQRISEIIYPSSAAHTQLSQ